MLLDLHVANLAQMMPQEVPRGPQVSLHMIVVADPQVHIGFAARPVPLTRAVSGVAEPQVHIGRAVAASISELLPQEVGRGPHLHLQIAACVAELFPQEVGRGPQVDLQIAACIAQLLPQEVARGPQGMNPCKLHKGKKEGRKGFLLSCSRPKK